MKNFSFGNVKLQNPIKKLLYKVENKFIKLNFKLLKIKIFDGLKICISLEIRVKFLKNSIFRRISLKASFRIFF